MFDYIRGKLVESSPIKAVVEANGIGYLLSISVNTYSSLPPLNESVLLFTSFVVREESHTLYGFLTREERTLFETFGTISGIGPKTALSLVGHMEAAHLHDAIIKSDVASLCRIPGIGKKTAERVVVEMKDRIKKLALPLPASSGSSLSADAISALIHLGYNPLEAQKAVKKILSQHEKEPELSQVISAALRSPS